MRKIAAHPGFTHLNGIDDHTVRNLPLVQAGAHVRTHRGPAILIVNQGAHMPDGKAILSPGQLEHYGWFVHDKSPTKSSRKPFIRSIEGYLIPLSIRDGLPYLQLRPYTDDEWNTLPKIIATNPLPWDPTCLDYIVDDSWYDEQPFDTPYFLESDYDAYGQPRLDRPQWDTLDDDDDDELIPSTTSRAVHRAEVRSYCTQLIQPELDQARLAYVQTRRQHKHRPEPLVSGATIDAPSRHSSAAVDPERTHPQSPSTALPDGESTSPLAPESSSQQKRRRPKRRRKGRKTQARSNDDAPALIERTDNGDTSQSDGEVPDLGDSLFDRDSSDEDEAPEKTASRKIEEALKVHAQQRGEKPKDVLKDQPRDDGEQTKANAWRKQPKRRRQPKGARKNGETEPVVETVLSDSDDSEPPLVARDPKDFESSSSESEAETSRGRPAFNSKAKSATGINHPPKKWGPKHVRKGDLDRLRQYIPFVSDQMLKKTLEATTQYATKGAVEGTTLRERIQAPNPVVNIPRRNEDVATDSLWSNTPAIDDGSTAAQFFIGLISRYRSVHPLGTTDKQFIRALMEEIRKRGAMNTLISDQAKAQISARVLEILRTFVIDNWQSEADQQWQNYSERGYKNTKEWVNALLNISGAPPELWLLALYYVCFLQNHTAYKSLGWRTPTEWLLGYTPDISVLLQFVFYQPVYYKVRDPSFPGEINEAVGQFVGVSEYVGNGMTYRILTDTGKVVSKSVVRLAMGPYKNLRLQPIDGHTTEDSMDEDTKQYRERFHQDLAGDTPEQKQFRDKVHAEILHSRAEAEGKGMPTVNIKSLRKRSFITNPDDEGEQFRATITDVQPTGEYTADGEEPILRFTCQKDNRIFEEVTSYNKMLEWCDRDLDKDDMHRLETILDHRKAKLPSTKGKWEVLVQWASGVRSWNCLNLTYTDDPVTVSLCALRNHLLETDGFRRCKTHVKNLKKFGRMINQARLKNYRRRPVYKYGCQVPRDHEEAMAIDERMGSDKWAYSESLELKASSGL